MIQPEDIRRKAENLYPDCLLAWLDNDCTFFPRSIPSQKRPEGDIPAVMRMVQELRAASKETLGYGYTVAWREVNSREYGRNLFPERILFETQDDLLRFIGKASEFSEFCKAVTTLRRSFPELDSWIRAHPRSLIQVSSSLDGLIEVLSYFRSHPRPDCFVRELPVSVDTKFIDRNKALLQQWLDRVLPPHAIRADEEFFERRYGLRYVEPQLLIRFLDRDVGRAAGLPCAELSIPIHTIAKLRPPVDVVLVVENKVNLFTLPYTREAIGLGGLGNGVSLLRYIPWLAGTRLFYWGDLDVEGLEILSRLRELFPQTRSVFMDIQAVHAWRHLAVNGTSRKLPDPTHLLDAEREAFAFCQRHNIRIEQERIPQSAVLAAYSDGLFERLQNHETSTQQELV